MMMAANLRPAANLCREAVVLAHTELMKYEVKTGISSHILQMGVYTQ